MPAQKVVDFKIEIDERKRIPLYEQFKEGIVERIRKAQLKPGTSLPPGRQIAEKLEISYWAVERAMRELVKEGFLCRISLKIDPLSH